MKCDECGTKTVNLTQRSIVVSLPGGGIEVKYVNKCVKCMIDEDFPDENSNTNQLGGRNE